MVAAAPWPDPADRSRCRTLFLCGDVMTGRGIDQILPHPSGPRIDEACMASAIGYVELAERANGPIARPVDFAYLWGDALDELDLVKPEVRIVNLETAVTSSDTPWPDKEVRYRMHPDNVGCLTAARIDACAIANNHVLDWGRNGLRQTIDTLRAAGIATAGAGADETAAAAPASIPVDGGKVLLFAFAAPDCGVPDDWAAARDRSGVHALPDLSGKTAAGVARHIGAMRQPGDTVIASIHWGGNWGYAVPGEHRRFARQLVDDAGVDLVHGHSSHHAKGIEVYRERLILYGCGDFINDYEGIGRQGPWRSDLGLMYFPQFERATGRLVRLAMTPTRIRRFQVHRADADDAGQLLEVLNREGERLGTRFARATDGRIHWRGA
jgi:poly-gamma-glutamate capsule biosynthesis protein CapA/YwtB (metallophosphatase superfamily)